MQDRISTAEAARRLGTTPPTIRRLLEEEKLRGSREQRGSRFRWLIDEQSVTAYLSKHGKFPGRSGPRGGASIESKLAELSEQVDALERVVSPTPHPGGGRVADLEAERDDLRAELVSVHESLLGCNRPVSAKHWQMLSEPRQLSTCLPLLLQQSVPTATAEMH